eukprot:7783087-Pyramimonas_sp.AAC.1
MVDPGAIPLGGPHLLEGTRRGKDKTTDPHSVLALRRNHNLDLLCGKSQCRGIRGLAPADAWEHC